MTASSPPLLTQLREPGAFSVGECAPANPRRCGGEGWGEGASRTPFAPHPGPLPTALSFPKVESPVGRGSRVSSTDVGDSHPQVNIVRLWDDNAPGFP